MKSLSESIEFISAKFDEHEPERQEKDKLICDVKTGMSIMKENIEKAILASRLPIVTQCCRK